MVDLNKETKKVRTSIRLAMHCRAIYETMESEEKKRWNELIDLIGKDWIE